MSEHEHLCSICAEPFECADDECEDVDAIDKICDECYAEMDEKDEDGNFIDDFEEEDENG